MEAAIVPSDKEVCEKIVKMGVDGVSIVRKNDKMCIAYYRRGGCGRIYKCVCSYLLGRFLDFEITLRESESPDCVCCMERVREPGGSLFL